MIRQILTISLSLIKLTFTILKLENNFKKFLVHIVIIIAKIIIKLEVPNIETQV